MNILLHVHCKLSILISTIAFCHILDMNMEKNILPVDSLAHLDSRTSVVTVLTNSKRLICSHLFWMYFMICIIWYQAHIFVYELLKNINALCATFYQRIVSMYEIYTAGCSGGLKVPTARLYNACSMKQIDAEPRHQKQWHVTQWSVTTELSYHSRNPLMTYELRHISGQT